MLSDSEPNSLAADIWKEVKSLSLTDIELYIANIAQPGEKLATVFASNPNKYDARTLHAVLLIHRYSIHNSTSDIVLASFIIQKAVSLAKDLTYGYFFFLLATHSRDLFERTMEIAHLERAIDLLDHFYAVQDQGAFTYLVAAVSLSSACLQYSLKADENQARESAQQILKEIGQTCSGTPWMSFGQNTTALLIIGDALRIRYSISGPNIELERSALAIETILDVLPDVNHNEHPAFSILVISIICFLAQTEPSATWITLLNALYFASQPTSQTSVKPSFSSNSPRLSGALRKLIDIVDQYSISFASRALCLIHMASLLKDEVSSSDAIEDDNDENPEETSSLWSTGWDAALLLLRARIQSLQSDSKLDDGIIAQHASSFQICATVTRRNELPNRRFGQADPSRTHICMFEFVLVPIGRVKKTELDPVFTHATFYRYLQKLCASLSLDAIEILIKHPETLDEFFAKVESLKSNEEPFLSWKKSRGVMAYLIARKGAKGLKNMMEIVQPLLSINLEREPGYEHLVYCTAANLIYYEKNLECVGFASKLFTEFLRIQKPGSPKHYIGILDLASTFGHEFLHTPERLSLLAIALEMFREAFTSRRSKHWAFEARKVVVLGQILRYRFKYFEDSDDKLEKTIHDFNVLWDLFPLGRPFSVSTLELITTSTLLYLAQDLQADRWVDAIELLRASLDKYINSNVSEAHQSLPNIKNMSTASQDLLNGALYITSYSMASNALCLFHMSDMLRSTALDICEYPHSLPISAKMYQRDLQLFSERISADFAVQEDNLASCWNKERGELGQVIISLADGIRDPSASFPSFEPARLCIFRYHAGYISSRNARSSCQHACKLIYHPTCVSSLPGRVDQDHSTPPSFQMSEADFPQWPKEFLPLSSNPSESSIVLPSTVVPGIEKVIGDENHEIFQLPLEARTIKALMQHIHHDIRGVEALTSNLSERLIKQAAEDIFWDPRDVQLNVRIGKLRANTPYLAQIGPLQVLLSSGPEKCLELIESSRALFWTRLLRLKTSLEGLPEHLKHRLEEVTRDLEACKSQSVASVNKEEMQRQFDLESVFAHLLMEVRNIPGFEDFLRPKTYDKLLQASAGGPVVVLLGSGATYAALIVRPGGVDWVLLEDLSDNLLEKLVIGLNKASSTARSSIINDQSNRKTQFDEENYDRAVKKTKVASYIIILDQLWRLVIQPVFRFMGLLLSDSYLKDNRSRLWWCPTGRFTFLPLHAARTELDITENVSKYVISSYTPTLSALISARQSFNLKDSHWRACEMKTLVLAQPTTKYHASLPMTMKELEIIEGIVPTKILTRVSTSEGSSLLTSNTNRSVEEAIGHIKDGTSILHLACHGHQDHSDPLNSGFQLEDGRLTLSKLISCHTPSAFLAFLSACESASNDLEIPDESLNLTAAMLYAGFRSIIGTMWTMNDNDGPEVARVIYEKLFEDPSRLLDPSVVPEALDLALQEFQRAGMHPSRWATYIHVGI